MNDFTFPRSIWERLWCNSNTSARRFQPDKEFAGTDRGQRRDGPVQFEKEEEDPFGLDKFLTEAKKGKRTLDEPSRSRYIMLFNLPLGSYSGLRFRFISFLAGKYVLTSFYPSRKMKHKRKEQMIEN